MVKNHLKTIAAPKTWPINRKSKVFIMRPTSGPHNLETGVTLNFVLTDMLKIASRKKEAVHILYHKEVLVDGKRRKDVRFPVGLFDVITIKDTKKNYRLIMSIKGKLELKEIDDKEAQIKPLKIKVKKSMGKKFQLGFYDGSNLLIDKNDYSVGDTVTVKSGKVKDHFKLAKGNTIFLTGGRNLGKTGVIEDITGNKILYKAKNEVLETLKKYAFVIGKDKPIIKLEK